MTGNNPNSGQWLLLYLCIISCTSLIFHSSQAQQSYVDNKQLRCEVNYTTTLGYNCSATATTPRCLSYVTFRSIPSVGKREIWSESQESRMLSICLESGWIVYLVFQRFTRHSKRWNLLVIVLHCLIHKVELHVKILNLHNYRYPFRFTKKLTDFLVLVLVLKCSKVIFI